MLPASVPVLSTLKPRKRLTKACQINRSVLASSSVLNMNKETGVQATLWYNNGFSHGLKCLYNDEEYNTLK